MWTTERLGRALGARLSGTESMLPFKQEEQFDRLHHELMEHQVLVFDGGALSPNDLAELGAGLGTVANNHHSYNSHPDAPAVVVLDWGGEAKPDAAEWHADMTYKQQPPFASVLQAVIIPAVGGDTLWASMHSVYESLPEGLRSELCEMEAVHDMGTFRTPAYQTGGHDGLQTALADAGTAVHPIVATHPVTGRPYINVSEAFTRFVIGLSAPESSRLLTMLFDVVKSPEHQVRLRWQPGTMAIWDNRGTQHYALADYLPERRVMHRVAIISDSRSPSPGDKTKQ